MGVEIINSGKSIKMHCIDDWSLGDTKDEFIKNIEPVKQVITVMEGTSWEVANKYKDRSIDFCFIDGGHDYKSVYNDIIAFMPKIKIGGIISGHDYNPNMNNENQVYAAVHDTIGIVEIIRNVWRHKI